MIHFVDFYKKSGKLVAQWEFVSESTLQIENLSCLPEGAHYIMIDLDLNIWTLASGRNDKDGVYIYRYSEDAGRKRVF